ncbi:hypothetical protein ES703_117770 [subsurface metagenome]
MTDLAIIQKAFIVYEAAIKAANDAKSNAQHEAWQAWGRATREAATAFKKVIGVAVTIDS